MSPPDPIESVRSYMLTEASACGPLNIMFERKIGRSPDMSSGASSDDEDRWSALQASNPRLHDGPILSVNIYDSSIRALSCRLDSYKRFAIQESKWQQTPNHEDRFDTAGVWLLGVKGWIIAKDRAGHDTS